jgi:hypothetical protein
MIRQVFNREILNNWICNGFGYLVTEEIAAPAEHLGSAAFIVYPLKDKEEAERFMLRKNRGTPYALQRTIVSYDILSNSAYEMAEGVFGYLFYTKEYPVAALETSSAIRNFADWLLLS